MQKIVCYSVDKGRKTIKKVAPNNKKLLINFFNNFFKILYSFCLINSQTLIFRLKPRNIGGFIYTLYIRTLVQFVNK